MDIAIRRRFAFIEMWPERVARGESPIVMKFELLPLLRHSLKQKMCGAASEPIAGLADRIESRLLQL